MPLITCRDFGIPIEIPIYIDAYKNYEPINAEFELSWKNLEDVPDSWEIELLDRNKNKLLDLRNKDRLKFNLATNKSKILAPQTLLDSQSHSKIIKDKAFINDSEFYIRIIPGEDGSDLPKSFQLYQNYPNPFNPSTNITFDLPIQSEVELVVFDILGRKVSELVSELLNAGSYTYTFDAQSLSSGIYFVRLTTSSQTFTKKMTFVK